MLFRSRRQAVGFALFPREPLAEGHRPLPRDAADRIIVGRLHLREWEAEGRSGSTLDLIADVVGHDLARGTSSFERVRRLTDVSAAA